MAQITVTVHLAPDLALRDRHRRLSQRLARIRHPAIAPITDVVVVSPGLDVTVDVPDDAEPLTEMATAAEVVILFAPVAAALAQVHDADLAWGPITSEHVWCRADGTGVLVGGGSLADPRDDLPSFMELLGSMLPVASVGADVVSLLVSGVDPDPSARPTMARVAAVLDLAARSLPLPQGAATSEVGVSSSPPAYRRSRVPAAGVPEGAAPVPPLRSARAAQVPSLRPARAATGGTTGRHAARAVRRIKARWVLVAVGALIIGVMGVGAVGADQPTVGSCVVDSSAAAAVGDRGDVVTSDLSRPARWPKRSADRAR